MGLFIRVVLFGGRTSQGKVLPTTWHSPKQDRQIFPFYMGDHTVHMKILTFWGFLQGMDSVLHASKDEYSDAQTWECLVIEVL